MSTNQPTNPHRGSDFAEFLTHEGLMPTPRTDAIAHAGHNESVYIAKMTYLARELERELAFSEKSGRQIWDANERLKRELDEAREQLAAEREIRLSAERSAVLANEHLNRERAMADRLAESLKQCLCGYTYDSDRALAAWKEARRGS